MATTGHVFISYSRKDGDFVTRLVQDLEKAGLNVWRDTDDLEPGTPNWEAALRHAIQDSAAIVLVASPDSRASVYVHAEITLAKISQIPIYPLWANGDQWINSIAMGMVNYQYIDCRGNLYHSGLHDIVRALQDVLDVSDGVVKVGLPSHEVIELNLAQFETAENILNHIYLKYLQDWFPMGVYGYQWVMGNVYSKQLALTWDWLLLEDTSNQVALFTMYEKAKHISYLDFGIVDGSYWAVWPSVHLKVAGIAVNDANLASRLLSPFGMRELELLIADGTLQQANPADIAPGQYTHQFLMAQFGQQKPARIAYIQAAN